MCSTPEYFNKKTFLTLRFVKHSDCSIYIYLSNHILNPLTLKDRCFINYLKYLHSYWTKPAYVKFLKYPLCLHFLELLQHEEFRKEIVNGQCAKFLDDQAILQWQQYTRKRIRLMENLSNPNPGNVHQCAEVSIKQEDTQEARRS